MNQVKSTLFFIVIVISVYLVVGDLAGNPVPAPYAGSNNPVPSPYAGSNNPLPSPYAGSNNPVPTSYAGSNNPVPTPYVGSNNSVPTPYAGLDNSVIESSTESNTPVPTDISSGTPLPDANSEPGLADPTGNTTEMPNSSSLLSCSSYLLAITISCIFVPSVYKMWS